MITMEATIFTGWIYDHLLPNAEKVKVAHPADAADHCSYQAEERSQWAKFDEAVNAASAKSLPESPFERSLRACGCGGCNRPRWIYFFSA
jgi:hypothetical protein